MVPESIEACETNITDVLGRKLWEVVSGWWLGG